MGSILRYLTGGKGPSGFGSTSTAEEVTMDCDLTSEVAIITGATSGIGEETARVLAKRGATVVIPARNLHAAEEVKARILNESPEAKIIILELDLTSFTSVRKFVIQFESLDLPLNILINNAGSYCNKFELSKDGFEMTFATNHLGPFLLTKLLLEKMIETAEKTGIEGRIVNVSSEMHRFCGKEGISFHQLTNPKSYNGNRAYGQSKLANILHVKELTARLKRMKANVTANALHPGVVKTNLGRSFPHHHLLDFIFFVGSKFMKSIPQGAATTCYAATSSQMEKVSGKYLADCNIAPYSAVADDHDLARQLWAFSETTLSRGKDLSSLFLHLLA